MQIQDVQKPEVGSSEVLVRMRLRPLNPADISLIQGRMGRPPLPLIPGTEGTSTHLTLVRAHKPPHLRHDTLPCLQHCSSKTLS